MEEMLKQLMDEKGSAWVQLLEDRVGFGQEQARGFLSGLADSVQGLFKEGKLDPSSLLGGDIRSVVENLDLAELGATVGVDARKAEQGVEVVTPEIVNAVKQKMGQGGLLDLLGGSGGLGGLAGKLFGK